MGDILLMSRTRKERSTWEEASLQLGLCSSTEWLHQYEQLKKERAHAAHTGFLASCPLVALPTILYLLFLVSVYALLIYCYHAQLLSPWVVTTILVPLQFMIFTPGHDAAHGAVSSNEFI